MFTGAAAVGPGLVGSTDTFMTDDTPPDSRQNASSLPIGFQTDAWSIAKGVAILGI